MEPVTIRRTKKDLPLMLLVAITTLFPGMYMMATGRTFMSGAILTLLVLTIASSAFILIFKQHPCLVLSKEGVTLSKGDQRQFYAWEDVISYRLETDAQSYYSNEMNSYQENITHQIILTLPEGRSSRITVDKLSKGPDEIIALFDLYKTYSRSLRLSGH
jgi:hypothetical protein